MTQPAGQSIRESSDQCVLAMDVGGTIIKAGIVDAVGTVLLERRWPTPAGADGHAAVTAALDAVGLMLEVGKHHRLAGVGLVVPGLVDDRAGVAVYSENIGWQDVPFRRLISDLTPLPIGFGHDVRAAGLAERRYGAAGSASDVLVMPIGTGIAGAMIVGSRLVTNIRAGEIGHIDVGFPDECACGSRGCLEAVASGAAIARRYVKASGRPAAGASEVLTLRRAGDQVAEAVWRDAIEALARALTTYISLLAPELVVIGGGLSGAGSELLEPLEERLGELTVWQEKPQIVLSALGDRAGLVGAALLAHDRAQEGTTRPTTSAVTAARPGA